MKLQNIFELQCLNSHTIQITMDIQFNFNTVIMATHYSFQVAIAKRKHVVIPNATPIFIQSETKDSFTLPS